MILRNSKRTKVRRFTYPLLNDVKKLFDENRNESVSYMWGKQGQQGVF